jgi:membrane protein
MLHKSTMHISGSKLWRLLKQTLDEWIADDIATHAAALAYFTVFAIAPTLIIAVAIAGLAFGPEAARGEIQGQLQGVVGDAGAKVIEDMMASAAKPAEGLVATVLGIFALLFGATGVFAALQNALNRIWDLEPRVTNGILAFLRTRFLSFTMVVGVGFLLLVSLVMSAGVSALGKWLGESVVWQVVNFVLSYGVITVLFAMIYKVLPDVKVEWRDVWMGAAVTAALFNVGKFGIGLYLGRSAVASSYGAAGSLAVLLLWVYYSALVLFLGAEFTQVYAHSHGSLNGRAPRPSRPAPTGGSLPAGAKAAH